MGYKIKTLGTSFRDFSAANIGPLNLTAGVPIAELFFGIHARCILAAGAGENIAHILIQMDEITVTRAGQTIVSIENGQDLFALIKAPWNDQAPDVCDGVSSSHYVYLKGLTLPCSYPSGAAGEFQLTVENALDASTGSEVLSIAEGQGLYAANYFGQSLCTNKLFHIVKRLYTPAGTSNNEGINIGTEGTLIGLLLWQTTEQGKTVAKTSISLYKDIELVIGGESVIDADCLTGQGTQGTTYGCESNTNVSFPSSILDEYVYIDFRRQPWDCRGKSVVFKYNGGTADAIRVYPIYMIDW